MTKFTPKQVTLDLEEYEQLIALLDNFRKPREDGSLTEEEQAEATGILLTRAVQNPSLFRSEMTTLDLGKYKAIFAFRATDTDTGRILIRFVRT